MTHKSELEAAWTLYCSDQQLNDAEHANLLDALSDDTSGQELAADQRLHRTLAAMGTIDKTKDNFIANVSAACADLDQPTRQTERRAPQVTSVPQITPLLPTRGTAVRRRSNTRSLLLHPFALLLAGTTLAMAITLAVTLSQYHSTQQQIIALQRLRAQQPVPSRLPSQPTKTPTAPDNLVPAPLQEIGPTVAKLTQSTDAVWKKEPKTASLSSGRWELERGTAELAMSSGSRIKLKSPVAIELKGPQHVSLDRGTLTATVPPDDIGFLISTPNARIVDLGTEFRVSVDEHGKTDVDLVRGEVVVIPWNAGTTGERWHLVTGNLDRATVWPSTAVDHGMLASHVSGPNKFKGQISLAGASMDLTSRERFDRLRNGVTTQLAASAADAVDDWLELTRTLDSTSGSYTMNGKEVPITGLDSVLNLEDSLLDTDNDAAADDSQNNSVFVGKININGQERTFNNRIEYEAFRQEMFQSLPGFGMPGPAEMQLDLDKKNNPFQP